MKYYIINKTPFILNTMECDKYEMVMNRKDFFSLKDIYAAMYCEEIRNITIIFKDNVKLTIISQETEEFLRIKSMLEKQGKVDLIPQSKKINSYASALIHKRNEGISAEVIPRNEKRKIVFCQICGMECDENIPYCMECGAQI